MSPRSPAINPKPLSVSFLMVPCGIPLLQNLKLLVGPKRSSQDNPEHNLDQRRGKSSRAKGCWNKRSFDNPLSSISRPNRSSNSMTTICQAQQILAKPYQTEFKADRWPNQIPRIQFGFKSYPRIIPLKWITYFYINGQDVAEQLLAVSSDQQLERKLERDFPRHPGCYWSNF